MFEIFPVNFKIEHTVAVKKFKIKNHQNRIVCTRRFLQRSKKDNKSVEKTVFVLLLVVTVTV